MLHTVKSTNDLINLYKSKGGKECIVNGGWNGLQVYILYDIKNKMANFVIKEELRLGEVCGYYIKKYTKLPKCYQKEVDRVLYFEKQDRLAK